MRKDIKSWRNKAKFCNFVWLIFWNNEIWHVMLPQCNGNSHSLFFAHLAFHNQLIFKKHCIEKADAMRRLTYFLNMNCINGFCPSSAPS